MPADGASNAASVEKFRERFSSTMTEVGFPRMPGRVFAALFTSDSGRLTAAELAEVLQVSPAAVSGAVRYLAQLDMVSRSREPGSRRDHYVVREDVWQQTMARRDHLLHRIEMSVREGVALLGTDSPAGARAASTLDFLEFLQGELPKLVDKWYSQRADRLSNKTDD